jgi:hypothetical protein
VATTNKWAKTVQKWLIRKLCWNFFIRVAIEVSLELAFGVMLNYPFLENFYTFTTFFEGLDYVMTVFLGILLILMPFFLIIFYCSNFDRLDEEDFKSKYSAGYEGLKTNLRAALFYNVIFILRRILLAATCLYLQKYLWLQLLISIYATTFTGVFLVHFSPFEEKLVQYLEVFNELTTIFLYGLVYGFTDIMANTSNGGEIAIYKRYNGYTFIIVIFFNIAVHLTFLMKDLIKTLIA